MIRFECDYAEGCHPALLKALTDTNFEQHPGYGADVYCERAKEKIRAACQAPNADVRFLVGGTQTNKIVIGTALAGYEGVIAAETGHVSLHEGGAIESTGHKVITLPHQNGKLNAATVVLKVKCGETGKVFGSIQSANIADALAAQGRSGVSLSHNGVRPRYLICTVARVKRRLSRRRARR